MVQSGTQTKLLREADFARATEINRTSAMSARKRRAQVRPGPQEQNQVGSPDLSAIDTAIFMEGLRCNHCKPLHSTAMEEELDLPETGGAAEEMEQGGTRTRRKTRPAEILQQEDEERGAGSEEEHESGEVQHCHRGLLTSDEEEGEEDIWVPNAKKTRVLGLGGPVKSSYRGSTSRKPGRIPAGDEASRHRQKTRPLARKGTHFQVVLDAFLGFCDQYSETVESAAVKQSVRCFSDNVREHLLEQISNFEKVQTRKRKNTKVGSLIHTKTQRLLEVKQELMRAERQLWLLQKEETGLQQRLADLKQGQAFLQNIRRLHSLYLERRADKETYGASSLAALLLETSLAQEAGHQP
uniref:Centromere protein U n=1 Tax=Nothobranchius kadleci TaxID=1051664 RepID=A0A1A8DJG5_NOTKA